MDRPRSAHLIVTVDYELFGNGTGCLDRCVVSPAKEILAIGERYDVPVTLFVEALEFARIETSPRSSDEANALQRVRSQLVDAVRRGHDVQLHLHPQWLHAAHASDGAWTVDLARWRIGDLAAGEVEEAIVAGKAWLEDTIRSALPGYRPEVFRAGAWCIQPEDNVVRILATHGFSMDSTVAPGLHNAARGDWYDFRGSPGVPWWRVDGDSDAAGAGGDLVEVPIAVGEVPAALRIKDLVMTRRARRVERDTASPGSYGGPNDLAQRVRGYCSKLAGVRRAMLDISGSSARVMKQVTKSWLARATNTDGVIPIVAIGHTKDFTRRSAGELDEYLNWITGEGIAASTYKRWRATVEDTGISLCDRH